jgi:hypothetical protein
VCVRAGRLRQKPGTAAAAVEFCVLWTLPGCPPALLPSTTWSTNCMAAACWARGHNARCCRLQPAGMVHAPGCRYRWLPPLISGCCMRISGLPVTPRKQCSPPATSILSAPSCCWRLALALARPSAVRVLVRVLVASLACRATTLPTPCPVFCVLCPVSSVQHPVSSVCSAVCCLLL